jgi:ferrous iron transport protein A
MTQHNRKSNPAADAPVADHRHGQHGHRHGQCQCSSHAAAGAPDAAAAGVVSLARLDTGESGKLFCINAGRSLCGRLTSMGLAPGMVIKVVRRQGGGDMVICAHRTRLALGRGMVEKIMVEPLPESASPCQAAEKGKAAGEPAATPAQ